MRDPLGQLRLRYAGLRLVRDGDTAQVYAGSDYRGNDVTVVVLTEAASTDPELRRSFAAAVSGHPTEQLPLAGADPAAERPWVAVASRPGAADLRRLLAGLGGEPVGDDDTDDDAAVGTLPGVGSGEPASPPRLPPMSGAVPPPPGPVAAPTRVPPPPVTPVRPDRSPPARPVAPAAVPGALRPRTAASTGSASPSAGLAIAIGALVLVTLVAICCVAVVVG